MSVRKVDNNVLGSYPVLVERTATPEDCQTVGIDFGVVSAGVLTPRRVSAADPLPVSSVSSTSSLANGRKIVTTAGTREALAASTTCIWVIITALLTNTGNIAVGGASVVAAAGSESGNILLPGDSITILIDNLSEIFLDSTVNSEGVSYSYGA